MAAVSLNLRLEQTVIDRMKEYAELEHTSLSQMVENIFANIVKSREKNVELNISPIVKAMSIDGIQVPAGFDYKQELAKGREEKYL
ncbi:hypothetical protein FACS1894199_01930 [Bacteroidia bacterium]|nr:hypothetical protein FACS1894199_01930 [Bacteroidia bacterium]